MSIAPPKIDRSAKRQRRIAPDFAVLLAGLSATQSASETARFQILLDQPADTGEGQAPPIVSLFANGSRTAIAATQGSFSVGVAESLGGASRK